MREHLVHVLVLLLVGAGCGGGSRLIAGVELGGKLRPDDTRFDAADGRQRKLRAPPRFEGRQPTGVIAYLDDAGVIELVEIQISVDKPEVAALEDWSKRLCKKIGGEPESHTPSPLGTPEPGETWDPVRSNILECGGKLAGRPAHVHFVHNSASDFDNANVTVTVTIASEPEPAE